MTNRESMKDMTSKFDKLEKFEGQDFRRWQKKMHFLLTTLKVVQDLGFIPSGNVVLSSTYVGKILGADQLLVILCYRYQESGIGYWILSMTISGSGNISTPFLIGEDSFVHLLADIIMLCDKKVIKEIYGPHGGFESNNSSNMRVKGSQTHFWSDIWCKEGKKLMEVFPRFYMLETNKECKVSDRWYLENAEWHGNWAWRSNSCGRAAADLVNMIRLVGNLVLSPESRDRWFWVLHPSGKFLVKDLFCLVESKSLVLGETNQNFIWNPWVPRKVNISIWRASMDRLPSRANLLNRGVEIASARCVLCDMENKVETVKHCLCLCPKAKRPFS
ncbi:RNA-directed DNA polymerase, eukaryota, reverse transcriptase zinc-binding domain protein [Tanacetum coccineum]